MLGSKQLLRTNPALTANFKLVVSAGYKLYMESFDSNAVLSDQRYKHFAVNEGAFLTERVPAFFDSMPNNLAFEVRRHTPSDTVQTDFNLQMDDAYWAGASPIEDRWHKEEAEYHAPLYVDPSAMPSHFVVLRVDGPGNYDLQAEEITSAGVRGFRQEMQQRWKCVKLFDMGRTTPLGAFLSKNFTNNEYFPQHPFELNLRKHQFSRWFGYDIKSGGFGVKSQFLQDAFSEEMSHYDMEELLTAGFQKNGVAMPHILNLKFLFDDTPGIIEVGRTARRKWSINRYLGFYLDQLTPVRKVSPYEAQTLRSDVIIANNEFLSGYNEETGAPIYVDPTEKGWPNNANSVYIKRGDDFLIVQRVLVSSSAKKADVPVLMSKAEKVDINREEFAIAAVKNVYKYIIIDTKLNNGTAASLAPNRTVTVAYQPGASDQFINGKIVLKNTDDTPLEIPDYQPDGLYLVEIGGEHYTLQRDASTSNGHFCINSDTLIETTSSALRRQLAGTELPDILFDGPTDKVPPLVFTIYQAKFTEQADLDVSRIDTGYSRFEREGATRINHTEEPKLWVGDNRDKSVKGDAYAERDYRILQQSDSIPNTPATPFYLPASSEYAAGNDLWRLNADSALTSIWDKNPRVAKWGYRGSLSHADYGYKINNSTVVGGLYNRTPSHIDGRLDRRACNLDWFYTVGAPYVNGARESNIAYTSLEIDMLPPVTLQDDGSVIGTPDPKTYHYFDLDAYADPKLSFDYFEWFFTQQQQFSVGPGQAIRKNARKYATFNKSDGVNGPEALFRGLNASLYWSVVNSPNSLSTANRTPATELAGYKFSAVLTKRCTDVASLHGRSGITVYLNTVHRNVLVAVWVYTPYNSATNFERVSRDRLYEDPRLIYNVGEPSAAFADITAQQLTLLNVTNAINDPSQLWGFSQSVKFVVVENTPTFTIKAAAVAVNASNVVEDSTLLELSVDGAASYKQGDYVKLPPIGTSEPGGDYRISKVSFDGESTRIIVKTNIPQTDNVVDLQTKPVVTKTVAARPFIMRLDPPDELLVNTGVNLLVPETVEITPNNTVRSLAPFNVLAKEALESLVLSPYAGQSISYKPLRNTGTEGTEKRVLFRHSGPYGPMLNSIEMFAPARLQKTGELLLTDEPGDNPSNPPENGAGAGVDGRVSVPMPEFEVLVGDIVVLVTNNAQQAPATAYKFTRVHEIVTVSTDEGPVERVVLDYTPSSLDDIGMPGVVFNRPVQARVNFDTSLTYFGQLRELLVSKTTRGTSPLKTMAPGSKYRSVYPMIDEHGMTVVSRFIFKSSWDSMFYNETAPYSMKRYQTASNNFGVSTRGSGPSTNIAADQV